MRRAASGASAVCHAAITEPRTAFWQRQVEDVVADGDLRPDTDATVLGITLTQLMGGVFLDWAGRVISAERLGDEAPYGFAMSLLAYAGPSTASRLAVLFSGLQHELARNERHTGRD